jgi:hypothetical protein
MGGDVGPRAAQGALGEPCVRAARALLLAVEEDEADLASRGRAQRAGELDDRRSAGSAIVGADEALRVVLGVVVRSDDDRRRAPRQRADDVAQAGMAADGLEAAAGQLATQDLGQAPQRPRPGGALAVGELAAEERGSAGSR